MDGHIGKITWINLSLLFNHVIIMKKQLLSKKLCIAIVLSFCCCSVFAQLWGTKTVGGSSPDYATLQAAIADLNLQGLSPGSGGVVFLVAAGHTETASNLLITATGNATDSVVFIKNGTGANPLITAAPGTGTMDAIIKLRGSDNIIFDGIDITDTITAPDSTRIEWGVAILKETALNGAQNVSIRNCTISLQKSYTGTVGIYAANHSDTSAAALILNTSGGRNASLKLYNNTISNVYTGILLNGYTDPGFYDSGNEIAGNNITNFGGGAVNVYAIRTTGQDSVKINSNTITGGDGTTANVSGISTITGTGFLNAIYGNVISLNSNAAATGIDNSMGAVGGTVQIYGNTVRNTTAASGFTGVVCYGTAPGITIDHDSIYGITITNGTFVGIGVVSPTGSRAKTRVRGNTIFNIRKTASTGGDMTAIYTNASGLVIDSNSLSDFVLNAGSSGTVFGVYASVSTYSDTIDIIANKIYDLHGGAFQLKAVNVYAKYANIIGNDFHNLTTAHCLLAINMTSITKAYINRNKIYDLQCTGNGSDFGDGLSVPVVAILATLGTEYNFNNNLISNLSAPYSSNGNDIVGIGLDGYLTVNMNYNTIYLHGYSTSGYSGSTAVQSWASTLTMRNNIYVNTSAAVGGAKAAVLRGSQATAFNTYTTASNNNLFYAGVPSSDRLLLSNPGAIQQMYQFKLWSGAQRDSLSFSEMPHFIDTNGASPDFLRIDTAFATQIESGGKVISSWINDFTSDGVRDSSLYPLSGQVNGGGSSPDVGAFEGDYKPVPNMSYASSTTTQFTGDAYRNVTRQAIMGIQVVTTGLRSPLRALSFTLRADSSTNIADIQQARLYYSASNKTFDTSLVFGAAVPTVDSFVISGNQQLLAYDTNYFWLAYNIASTAAAGSLIDAGCIGITLSSGYYVPSITDPAGNKVIPAPLAGDYHIGAASASYTTITAAVRDLNLKGISSTVNFLLTDSFYSSETLPLTINTIIGTSPTDTFVIKPDTNVNATISGSGNGFVLSGADHVTIDGSNNGTNSRNLKINTGGTAAIWCANAGSDSCMYNVFKNLQVSAFNIGIGFGAATISTSSQGLGHHYNRIENCQIGTAATSIYSAGSTRKNKGNVFTGNTITNGGILVMYEDSIQIINNTLSDLTLSFYGISLGITSFSNAPSSFEVTNALVSGNKIGALTRANSAAVGIAYGSATSGTTRIYNNLIRDVIGSGTVSGRNTVGVYIGTSGTSNVKFYHNTIVMRGNSTRSTPSCYGIAIGGTSPVVDLRNNIVYNVQTSTSANSYTYAIGYAATTFTGVTSNYNCFYTSGSNARFAVTGGLGINTAGTIRNSLTALQTATSTDASSLSVDPQLDFTSGYSPKLLAIISGGTPLADVTTDIDGAVRNLSTPTLGAYEIVPILNDIGVLAVRAESGGLYVKLQNFGSNLISPFNVSYRLNSDSAVMNSYGFSISPYDTTSVFITPFVIPNGVNTLKVYTSMPNTFADTRNINDTVAILVSYPLAGTYTIGGVTPDYATFSDAVYELTQRGVNADVTFIARSGVYNEHIRIKPFAMDSVRWVTFGSEAAHRDSVTLTYGASSVNDNYTLFLDSVSRVQIKHLTVEATGATYANALSLGGPASYTVIDSCKVISTTISGSGYYKNTIAGDVLTGTGNRITNNTIVNGNCGVLLNGYIDVASSIWPARETVIENNTVTGSYGGSIRIIRSINVKIKNNTTSASSTSTAGYAGIYCTYCDSLPEITSNRIGGFAQGTGLWMEGCKGINRGGIIANNEINAGDGYGIYHSPGSGSWDGGNYNLHYYHNTVNAANVGGAAGYFSVDNATWFYNLNTGVELRNNIFSNTAGGYALWMAVENPYSPSIESDYNNLYTTGADLARRSVSTNNVADVVYQTLAGWRVGTGRDPNSVSYNPAYTATNNLTPNPADSAVWSLNGRAQHLDSIWLTSVDINGNARPFTRAAGVPDLGAHEVIPASLAPLSIVSGAVAPDSLTVFLSPFSPDTVAKVKWDVSSAIPSTLTARQYAGEPPPGIAAPLNFMYFFTDFKDSGIGVYQYTLDVFYKDLWLGTNPQENDVMLAANTSTTGWQMVSGFTTTTTDTALDVFHAQSMPSFSLFTGTDMYSPLPVTLLNLSAIRKDDQVRVSWQTASEANAASFEVERKDKSGQWTKLGTLKAKGNSSSTLSYSFTDINAAVDQTWYYRLKLNDADGRYTYSTIAVVVAQQMTGPTQFSVYPNPFANDLFVTINAGQEQKVKLIIIDISGKVIEERSVAATEGLQTLALKTESLQAGIYFITAEANGKRETQKLVKSR